MWWWRCNCERDGRGGRGIGRRQRTLKIRWMGRKDFLFVSKQHALTISTADHGLSAHTSFGTIHDHPFFTTVISSSEPPLLHNQRTMFVPAYSMLDHT